MKKLFGLYFEWGNADIFKELYEQIKTGIPKEYDNEMKFDHTWNVWLNADSEEYKTAVELAKKHNLKYRLFSKTLFTKKEINDSKYFHLYLPCDVLELEGTNLKDYKTEYIGGCEQCGLGACIKGDVLIDRKFMRNKRIGIIKPEYFVSREIRSIIETENFSGIEFEHNICDYKGRDISEFFTMSISSILPCFSKETRISKYKNDRYSKCGHYVQYVDSEFYYTKEAMRNACDFNLTQEYINNSRMRQIIVSARVRDAFRKHKINVWFTPIIIL